MIGSPIIGAVTRNWANLLLAQALYPPVKFVYRRFSVETGSQSINFIKHDLRSATTHGCHPVAGVPFHSCLWLMSWLPATVKAAGSVLLTYVTTTRCFVHCALASPGCVADWLCWCVQSVPGRHFDSEAAATLALESLFSCSWHAVTVQSLLIACDHHGW